MFRHVLRHRRVGCLSTKNTGLSALTRSFSSAGSSLLCPAFRPYCTTTLDPVEDPRKMKVVDLRASLERRGMDTSGLKAALKTRLAAALAVEANPPLDDPVKESIRLAAMSGANIFFTGSAGTGKSFTIDAIVEGLKAKHGDDYADAVAVTAPTGVASLLIGGQTLGSFAGVGVPKTTKDFVSYSCGCHPFFFSHIVLRSSRSHY